jgi:peptidoglycan/xylan/chitin deacetylase (PgdA/CDA1 family)
MSATLRATFRPWLRRSRRLVHGAMASAPLRGGLTLWHWPGEAVRILTYHSLGRDDEPLDAWTVVRRSDFLKQVDLLRTRFDIVDLDRALAGEPGPRPFAVLTFDDGHRGWVDHLLPIVRRENLPVTLYVATGHVETGQAYWFDRLMNTLQVAAPARIDLSARRMGTFTVGESAGLDNWLCISDLLERLKQEPLDVREAVTDDIERQLRDAPRRAVEPICPLTPAEVRSLADQPGITLGSHSHCHRLLDQIGVADALASIDHSRSLLKAWTGHRVAHFAYPNGNHTAALAAGVERLGFASAATSDHGVWSPGESRFAIRRLNVGRYDDLQRFAYQATYRRSSQG